MLKQRRKLLVFAFLIGGAIAYLYYQKPKSIAFKPSNYSIYSKSLLKQFNFSSGNFSINNSKYRPIADWSGRLILPDSSKLNGKNFVYLEVHNAPAKYVNLVGKIVKLQSSAQTQKNYINTITKNVEFTQATFESQKAGNIHPERLNGRHSIDPLQSLAGSRPNDDVFVKLEQPIEIFKNGKDYTLVINEEPIQVSGTEYALVTVESQIYNVSNKFLIRHFNSKSHDFTGDSEVIKIPESIPDRDGIKRFTNNQLEKSWYNSSGWYIYGTKDSQGTFVVQSIIPRKIVRLQPDTIRLNKASINSYINSQWDGTTLKKGTAEVSLLSKAEAKSEAISHWQEEGNRAIVIHIYGGIGGRKAEPTVYGIVTGHFAYGVAKIVREPISNELIFDTTYYQIYAHNLDGIVAGKISSASYLGDLQRGWLGNRPISDIIIKLDPVTQDYNFGGIKLSPLNIFANELQKMMARYRIGDGSGSATVSPVTSCVQDANQALYITIKNITKEVQNNPKIQNWLQLNTNHPQTERFNRLISLGADLEKNLVPLGIVRNDWQSNVEQLAGIKQSDSFLNTILKGILSWRTILPRRAHDEITTIFLNNGASAWVIRTNQLGGFDPDIAPLAPTTPLLHNN